MFVSDSKRLKKKSKKKMLKKYDPVASKIISEHIAIMHPYTTPKTKY